MRHIVLNGEKLHIDGNFIVTTAANRPDKPIIWPYDPNGRSVERVDRLTIKNP